MIFRVLVKSYKICYDVYRTTTSSHESSPMIPYTECKYGGPLGRPRSSCAKARLVRPQEFCFDCAS